ncbi:MAG: WS/DGAT/MGAT family O-acyltransferase, partial [Ilumatobacteraceae bacterium]
MTQPMGPLDALFLHVEDGITHMHIGSCSVFEGPAPSIGELTTLIESKLPLVTRYRQKVRFVPGGLGHPVWVDDPHFDIDYHVRHSALPAPGTADDLENLMGRLMSQELDRNRPLWEAWIVEGLPDGRWAMITKVHHCMVDGISGTDLIAVLLDADPAAVTADVEPWAPAPEPSDFQLTVQALTRLGGRSAREFLARPFAGLHPRTAWSRAKSVAAGLQSFGTRLTSPAKAVSVEGSIGPHRRWAAGRCSLSDMKDIRTTFGGSVNDVVLAAISGAFRKVLIERGDPVDDVVLRSLVPVSVRHADDHEWNNQVSLMVADLPVGIADPVERLRSVQQQMQVLKASHQVTAGEAVIATAQFLPPILLSLGARAAMTVQRRMPQRTINTVTTNVPGPQHPLYALGRQMLEYLPFVPLSEGVRIGVAILSYNGQLTFGVTGDYDTAPDVHFMAEQIEAEVKRLRVRAGYTKTTKSGRRS